MQLAQDPSYGQGSFCDEEVYVAIGTGLGYYIDPKPEHSEPFCWVNGTPVYKEEDETRYVPTHLQSGMKVLYWFYEEQHTKAFIEALAAIEDFDWNQSVEELQKNPKWQHMSRICQNIAQEVTKSKVS